MRIVTIIIVTLNIMAVKSQQTNYRNSQLSLSFGSSILKSAKIDSNRYSWKYGYAIAAGYQLKITKKVISGFELKYSNIKYEIVEAYAKMTDIDFKRKSDDYVTLSINGGYELLNKHSWKINSFITYETSFIVKGRFLNTGITEDTNRALLFRPYVNTLSLPIQVNKMIKGRIGVNCIIGYRYFLNNVSRVDKMEKKFVPFFSLGLLFLI